MTKYTKNMVQAFKDSVGKLKVAKMPTAQHCFRLDTVQMSSAMMKT